MVEKVITVRNELMEELNDQLLGGSEIGFPGELSFQGPPKGGQSRR